MLLGIEMLQVLFFIHSAMDITFYQCVKEKRKNSPSLLLVAQICVVYNVSSTNPNLHFSFMQTLIINTLLEKLPEYMLDG